MLLQHVIEYANSVTHHCFILRATTLLETVFTVTLDCRLKFASVAFILLPLFIEIYAYSAGSRENLWYLTKENNNECIKVTANLIGLPSGKSFVNALKSVKLQQTIYHRKGNKMKNPNIWTFEVYYGLL